MSDNAEEGIARAQAAAARAAGSDGLRTQQQRGISNLNDRIVVSLLVIAFIGLLVIWATASSPILLYGSFAIVILLTIVWGLARIKRIERVKQERARQASEWRSGNQSD